VRVLALILPIVLVGCSAAPAEPSRSPSAIATPSASASATTAAPTNPEGELLPLQALLPSQLSEVELHTFPVGQDTLDRLAANLGVAREEVEVAYASEHGARFFQMYAVRLAGSPASSLATAWAAIAYPPDVTDVSVVAETSDGRAVTLVHAPSAAARLGTFYLLPQADTLIVVQALDRETAEEALAALP
jgi:hypothetical protein